jgi:hypothetical protein
MDDNPYKSPEQRARRLPRFKLKHVPYLIAGAIALIVFAKLATLFIELAVSLAQETLPKISAPR